MEFRSLEIKISRSENLPVLPQIASSVLKMADDKDASARDMEKLIERDSAIAAKVLRVANSAYYGLDHVPSISRAISILGMNTVRSLVLGLAYQQVIGSRQASKCFCKVRFWRHSVAVATAARILGKIKSPKMAEELYTAALMHDVGFLVMDRFAPDELDQASYHAMDNRLQMHVSERQLFGFDHAQIGGLLAERWGIGGAIRSAIEHHHKPWEDDKNMEMTTFVSIADTLANQCGYTTGLDNVELELDTDLIKLVELPMEQLDPIRAVIVSEVEKAQEALQIRAAA